MIQWFLNLFGFSRTYYCKNCGKPLRGLKTVPEIPIHVDTESRFCDVVKGGLPSPVYQTRWAEW